MGNAYLVAFPVIILAVSVVMQGIALTGSAQTVCYNITNASCTQNGSQVTYTCPPFTGKFGSKFTVCQVAPNCTNPLPSPAFCFLGVQYINPGDTLTVQATQTSGSGVFNFGAVGSSGLIAFIGVVVAIAVLSGFQIVGSGLNQMSTRILFFAGLMTGVWLFFSSLDGFLGGSNGSFFTQLNTQSAELGLLPFGTIAYVMLTVFEILGIGGYISGMNT